MRCCLFIKWYWQIIGNRADGKGQASIMHGNLSMMPVAVMAD
jgi:hypothetical protein